MDSDNRILRPAESERDSVAKTRIYDILDQNSFVEMCAYSKSGDGPCEAVCGFGKVDGRGVYVFSQNPDCMGGAMSTAQANKILKLYELAQKNGAPIVGIFDSAGGYVDKGAEALYAFSKVINAASLISGVVPQIAVVFGKCTGQNAVLCAQFDIVLMEKSARLSFGPASLYKNGQDVGSADMATQNGTAHIAFEKKDIAGLMRSILGILPSNNLAPLTVYEAGQPSVCPVINAELLDAEHKLHLSDDFGKDAETLLARINGKPCGAVLTKNRKLDANSVTKICRFVRMCDCFSIPVISIIDADGFSIGKSEEMSFGARLSAQLCSVYCEATTPKIAVITGRACGAIYSAFAAKGCSADMVFSLLKGVISPLSPEGAAIVLYDDRLKNGEKIEKLAGEYEKGLGSAVCAAEKGLVDDIIVKSEIRQRLSDTLDMLENKRESRPSKKHTDFPF